MILAKNNSLYVSWYKLIDMIRNVSENNGYKNKSRPSGHPRPFPASWRMIDQVGIWCICCKLIRDFFFFFSVRWHVWLYNPVSARQYIINGLNIFCHVTHWTVVTCEWTCNPRCTLHNSCFFCISFSEFRIVFLQVTDNRLINITMWLLVH